MVQFQFRNPKFPLLLETDSFVVGANNKRELDALIKKLTFESNDVFQVIDASAEGWSFYPKYNVITPLTFNKRWTKKGIIEFYNESIQGAKDKVK